MEHYKAVLFSFYSDLCDPQLLLYIFQWAGFWLPMKQQKHLEI